MFKEKSAEKGSLFREFWAQKPNHLGGTYPYPQHVMYLPWVPRVLGRVNSFQSCYHGLLHTAVCFSVLASAEENLRRQYSITAVTHASINPTTVVWIKIFHLGKFEFSRLVTPIPDCFHLWLNQALESSKTLILFDECQ